MSDESEEKSLGDLFAQFSEQASHLLREEVHLAELEMKAKAKSLGTGIGLYGAASVVAHLGAAALVATAIIALCLILPAWLAALIITVLLFAAAGILAALGRRATKNATPPMPQAAMAGVRDDVDVIRKGSHHAAEGTGSGREG